MGRDTQRVTEVGERMVSSRVPGKTAGTSDVADVVAQRADIGDVVVQTLQFQQRCPIRCASCGTA